MFRFHHPFVLRWSAVHRVCQVGLWVEKHLYLWASQNKSSRDSLFNFRAICISLMSMYKKNPKKTQFTLEWSVPLSCHYWWGRKRLFICQSKEVFSEILSNFLQFSEVSAKHFFHWEHPKGLRPARCLEPVKWQHSIGIDRDHTVPAWSLASSQSYTIFPLLSVWGKVRVQQGVASLPPLQLASMPGKRWRMSRNSS